MTGRLIRWLKDIFVRPKVWQIYVSVFGGDADGGSVDDSGNDGGLCGIFIHTNKVISM